MRSPWLHTKYIPEPEVRRLRLHVDGHDFVVLLNPEFGSWLALNSDEAERYDSGQLTECEWENLYVRGLARNAESGVVAFDFPAPAERPSLIIVNVTTACNLSCRYCFADCQPGPTEVMQSDVIDATVSKTLALPEIELFTYEFQGGEPTLATEVIGSFIDAVESRRGTAHRIKYRIQSNGTNITDEFIRLVRTYDIKVGISIDGPSHLHDATRTFANGQGSYEEISAGIARLRASGASVEGSICTLGSHNIGNIPEIVEHFDSIDIPFSPRPLNILGRAIDCDLQPRPGEWATAFRDMHRLARDSRVENFAIHIWEENVYTPVRDYICLRFPCGAGREVVSVNPNGDVFPCDGFKNLPEFRMGNIRETALTDMLALDWVQEMRQRTAATIPRCSGCMFRGMCGSCCYSAFGAFGTLRREDPQCNDRRKIFVYLISEWIRTNILKTPLMTNAPTE